MSKRAYQVAGTVGVALALSIAGARAQEPLKIGLSVGLTGYVAGADIAWRDGAMLAIDHLNGKGGIKGRKIEAVIEDNRSEPQAAVTIYRRMLSDDKVSAFVSGCLSAGNIAAAPMLVRAQVPMVVCSLLPTDAKDLHWSYSILPAAKFDIVKQFEYLQSVGVTRVGILHDPSPYVLQELKDGQESVANYGISVVGVQQYRADDADLSVQINALAKGGAQAIVKLGLGGTVVTAAKNIRDLGLNLRYSVMTQDMSLFKQVGDVLGDKFDFVVLPTEIPSELPNNELRAAVAEFTPLWTAKFKDRDPGYGGRGWDAVMILAEAATRAKAFDGASLRDALDTIDGFVGTSGVYSFTGGNRYGVAQNPYRIATIVDGKIHVVK